MPLPAPLGDAALHLDYFDHAPDCRFHFHRTFELVYVQGTSGTRLLGDTLTPYGAEGSLLLIGPLVPHTWIAHPKPSARHPIANRVVHFTRESLGLDLLQKAELTGVRRLLRDAATGVVFDAPATRTAREPLAALARLDATERLLGFLTLLHRLADRRHYRRLAGGPHDAPTLERDHTLLARVLQRLHEQPDERPSLEAMARRVGMSRATFTRFFRRVAGVSFITYLNDGRIGRAAALLRDTRRPVLEIALEAGYGNLAHFHRQFQKRLHTTPSGYRTAQTRRRSPSFTPPALSAKVAAT